MRRINHQKAEDQKSNLGRCIKGLLVLLVAAVFLEVWAVNRLSTSGSTINELKRQEVTVQLQNQVLEDKIAQASSLSQVASKSGNLGFHSISTVEYIKPEVIAATF